VVRDIKTLDELIERSRDISMSPQPLRAQRRRSFATATPRSRTPTSREIMRVDARFERIFGLK
jgi:hypothetical protein